MRMLLDAHTLLWAVDNPSLLGTGAAKALEDPANGLLRSAGTIWELAIKVGLGRLAVSLPFREWMRRAMDDLAADVLPITVEYADVQASLPFHHRDPFDRLLIAQARVEDVPIVSADVVLEQYGIARIW